MLNNFRNAARCVRRGGVIAYPTEAVFGLGCDPRNRRAVYKLLRIKRRTANKGLIVIDAALAQLTPYVRTVPPQARASWPGPHTWLLDARRTVPFWLRGRHKSLAVRVTAHRVAAALCHAAGMALVSTSANRSNTRPARNARDVARRFGHALDYIVPGRVNLRARPTPITDARSGAKVRI